MKSIRKTAHRKVRKHLNLRHHKHTGKLLAHKHTSYRVLFLLMLLPIGLMALVQNLNASALDLGVTATVPAPIPVGTPTIDNPTDNTEITKSAVTISGTCPVIAPPILIVIYDGTTARGSTTCSASGTYAITISLGYGSHTIVATVVTITNGVGNSSSPITIVRTDPPAPAPSPSPSPSTAPGPTSTPRISVELPQSFPQVISKDNFAIVTPQPSMGAGGGDKPAGDDTRTGGTVEWKFSIKGGALPYIVSIDWGDGTIGKYNVPSNAERVYTHTYETVGTYIIKVKVTDAKGRISVFNTVATAQSYRASAIGLGLDSHYESTPPFIVFLQQYMWQIYIAVFSALIFLWYWEHSRHFHRPLKH